MDCNKTSWDAYSEDSSEEESKQNESPLIMDAKINLFLRRYNSCPLEKDELIEVFVQSNFDESTIDLVINKKLIEQQKIKNNLLKSEKNKKTEEENKKNQSKDSWKEAKQNTSNNTNNNQKYKKSKYNKNHNNNYNFNYNQNNHSSRYYYPNKKHYKKNYKSYNRQKNNYIEREIEFNSKNELDNNEVTEDNFVEKNNVSLSPEFSADSNSKNSKENTEETSTLNSLELLNLNLSKSQSEELNHKNYDLNEVGIKLFPGIYKSKKFNFEFDKNCNSINNINKTDYINMNINNCEEEYKKVEDVDNSIEKNGCINNKSDFKQNFLHKANSNMNRPQQKDGLALAFDYYSSFLEDTKK